MAKALKRFLISSSLSGLGQNQKREARTVLLTPEETHHLKNVLRIKEGSLCLLFDRDGNEFVSCLERFRSDARSEAKLIEPILTERDDLLKLTVAQAIPQDRKMDLIVQKSAELGVFKLIPLVTERTVVRIAAEQVKKVHARWERIVEQTLKQSRIRRAPEIAPPTSFEELLSRFSQYDRIFLPHTSPDAKPIRESLLSNGTAGSKVASNAQILLMIGPEGGFSPREVEESRARGAQVVRMGSGILKMDTAFVAAVGFFCLMYS